MRRLLILTACLACALLVIGAAIYKKWLPFRNAPSPDARTASSQEGLSYVPPFSTREPETYTATRLLTFSESWSSSVQAPSERTSRVLIARDGEKRREEFSDGSSEPVVYLETTAGRFVLLPSSEVYANLSEAEKGPLITNLANESPDLSTNLVINEGWGGSKYQKLDAEMLEGRMATKYRVTSGGNPTTASQTETFIWIDEALGMPVRSETNSSDGALTSKTRMELKEIRLTVKAQLFELPPNYQKVEMDHILDKLYRQHQPAPGEKK